MIRSIMPGLAGAGLLWLCGSAWAGIALLDGGLSATSMIGSGSGSAANATISVNFTVSSGASVMVVELWDRDAQNAAASPSFLTWSNTTTGTTQTLALAVAQVTAITTYSWCNLYYLFNPTPGTGTVFGTDTNEASVQNQTMMVFDLSGVNTAMPPATNSITAASATTLLINSPASTAAGSFAAMLGYDANTGSGLTEICSSGTVSSQDIPNSQEQTLGYVSNLPAGSSTFTINDAGGATKMTLAVAIFTPLFSSGTNAVTPQFSNLSNQTINYGATSVSLTGTAGTTTNYLPNGATVTASVDGMAQAGTVDDATGDFNISYDAEGIPSSATPYTVTYISSIANGFNAATNSSTTMTVNPLPVVLSGFMVYNGTAATPASDLTVANLVDSDNLTLSGSVDLAGSAAGAEAIISFSGLTLGGMAAANYTLTGASGTVTITSSVTYTNWNNLVTNWVQTSAPSEPWQSIASSSDGTHLVAVVEGGGIYTSTNAGVTWTQTSAPSAEWWDIASSTDGTKLAAVVQGGSIYSSTNAGATWAQTSAPSVGSPSLGWWSIASSSDGTHLAAVVLDGGIYTSTDTGAIWTQTSAPTEGWYSIASSSDGAKLAALVNLGGIYASTNAGATWTQTSAPNTFPTNNWWCIASSSDGAKLAAGDWGRGIYTSTNAGVTWTRTSAPNESWYSIASSSDGTKLAAVSNPGGIYTSTNAGATWTETSAPSSEYENWSSIASSSDGTKLAATDYGAGIWTAQATIQTISPSLTISLSGNAAIISWPDAGSYTLQQSCDLSAASWATSSYPVSTSNGTNSITVTPTTGNLFFRLTQP
jgi:photosystem II stability/assembly factor-like uncharacterized protein